jgi:serine protease AprX
MKKNTQILLCLISLFSEILFAQSPARQRSWIFLRTHDAPVLPSVHPSAYGISERAMKRRAKVLPADRLLDHYDLPISESEVALIKATGVKIRTLSRWFHALSVEGTVQQIQAVSTLPIVAATKHVAAFTRPKPIPMSEIPKTSLQGKRFGTQDLDYGYSATQLTNINAVELHTMGVTGSGVLIGMLDDGFNNHTTHRALKNVRIIAEYDFVYNDDNTEREPWESYSEGNHGAGTLSEIAAYDPGSMIGAAFGSSFILAKTENDSGETSIEEDNYVAGLEWMERLGVDITSSSLGYDDLDPMGLYNPGDIVYRMKDGRTSITTRAIAIAARKGVLAVTAMGNEGWGRRDTLSIFDTLSNTSTIRWYQERMKNSTDPFDSFVTGSLVTPADADSILAVGATSSDRELAAFSCTGPTADGRIKPDLVAQGMAIYWVEGSSTSGYTWAAGTSCSTPLVAGAAALVLSAHPELTAMQVREALIRTSLPIFTGTSQTAAYPNNYYGNGFINARSAALFYGPIFSSSPSALMIDSSVMITTKIMALSGSFDSLLFYYRYGSSGALQCQQLNSTSHANEYTVSIPPGTENTFYGYFYAREHLGAANKFPFNAPDSLYSFSIQLPVSVNLHDNYPNPFNSGTVISFDLPQKDQVELSVFNILGQHVCTIYSGEAPIGRNNFHWNGTNSRGIHLASGVYFYRLRTSHALIAKKMLYLK